MLMLPFAATIPEGVKAYTIAEDFSPQELTNIAAHQPVLVVSSDSSSPQNVTFTGSGDVAFTRSALDNLYRGSYVEMPLYAGDYILGQEEGQWGLKRLTATSTLTPFNVYAQIKSTEPFIPIDILTSGIVEAASIKAGTAQYYDLQGRRITNLSELSQGQVVIIRKADGKAGKKLIK